MTNTHASQSKSSTEMDHTYLEDDTVFAVKSSLIVDFKPLKGENVSGKSKQENTQLELEYDVMLAPLEVEDVQQGVKKTNAYSINDNAPSI